MICFTPFLATCPFQRTAYYQIDAAQCERCADDQQNQRPAWVGTQAGIQQKTCPKRSTSHYKGQAASFQSIKGQTRDVLCLSGLFTILILVILIHFLSTQFLISKRPIYLPFACAMRPNKNSAPHSTIPTRPNHIANRDPSPHSAVTMISISTTATGTTTNSFSVSS